MKVGARQAGLCISETVDLLSFSHITVFRIYTDWCEKLSKKKKSIVRYLGRNAVLIRDVRRMIRLFQTDRKPTATQLITVYNCGKQKSILQ